MSTDALDKGALWDKFKGDLAVEILGFKFLVAAAWRG